MTFPMKFFVVSQFLVLALLGAVVGIQVVVIIPEVQSWQEKEVERQKDFEAARKRQILQEATMLVKQREHEALIDRATEKLKKALSE